MVMRTTPLRDTWLRFAVLRHYGYPGREDHYDILLEVARGQNPDEAALLKFESESSLDCSDLHIICQGNIRRRYLGYEGEMSGNRGRVERVDEGRFRVHGLDSIVFRGRQLRGQYFLDSGSPCDSVMSIKQTRLLIKAD